MHVFVFVQRPYPSPGSVMRGKPKPEDANGAPDDPKKASFDVPTRPPMAPPMGRPSAGVPYDQTDPANF